MAAKGKNPYRLYSNVELLHRPLEHVLEDLSCAEISRAIGCSRNTAWLMKRGDMEVTPAHVRTIYRWLQVPARV